MKRLATVAGVILTALLLFPLSATLLAAPNVPITYEGDTQETIARRLKWIEGAKQEQEIMWWTSIRPKQVAELGTEFSKIYPFVTLKFWRGRDQERQMRVEGEHAIGRLSADLCDAGGMEHYPRWRKIGLVEPFVHLVPGLNKRNPRSYSKSMDWIQPGNNAIVPMYNTELIPPAEAPKSWEDLLDPKWKGQIGLTTDVKAWYVLALAEGGWGMEKTEAFLKELAKQKPIWAKGHSAGHALLVAGEFKIFGENYLRYLFRKEMKTAPVDWVRVSPVPVTGGTFFLTKNAPHPNAARLFLEWVFSPEGGVVFERITGYGAADPGSGSHLSKVLMGSELVYRDEDVLMQVTNSDIVKRFSNLLGIAK